VSGIGEVPFSNSHVRNYGGVSTVPPLRDPVNGDIVFALNSRTPHLSALGGLRAR